jgi:hypothetical protein
MKIGLIVVAAFAATLAQTKEPEFQLTICTDAETFTSLSAAIRSRAIVSRIYSKIGVDVKWHRGLTGCPPRSILISLTEHTPTTLLPRALAYAMPYEGAHIRVFYDRIVESGPEPLREYLLAHVLAHEIAHLLQGLIRHSDRGLMKPHWDPKDLAQMSFKPLPFTQQDIDLIHQGLRSRMVAEQPEPD